MLLPPGSAVLNGGSNDTQSFCTTMVAAPPRFGAPAGAAAAGFAASAGFAGAAAGLLSAGFAGAAAGLLSAGFAAGAAAGAHACNSGKLAAPTAPMPSILSN